jgi:hypothetical protein
MKKYLLAAIAGVGLISSANAKTSFMTGDDLYKACTTPMLHEDCTGYIMGVVDTLLTIHFAAEILNENVAKMYPGVKENALQDYANFCVPDGGINAEELVGFVLRSIRTQGTYAKERNATEAVVHGLAAEYGCKSGE